MGYFPICWFLFSEFVCWQPKPEDLYQSFPNWEVFYFCMLKKAATAALWHEAERSDRFPRSSC